MLGATNTLHNDKTLRRVDNPMYEETGLEELILVGVEPTRSTFSHVQEAGPTYEVIPLPASDSNRALKKSGKSYGQTSTSEDKLPRG